MGPCSWLSAKCSKLGCSSLGSLRKRTSSKKSNSFCGGAETCMRPLVGEDAQASCSEAASLLNSCSIAICGACCRPEPDCCCPRQERTVCEQAERLGELEGGQAAARAAARAGCSRGREDLGFVHAESLSASLEWGASVKFGNIKQIGRGRSSLVYSAVCTAKGKPVVVKIYQKALLTREGEQQVRREIECLKSVKHDNIIELYTSFENDQGFFLVFEHARGGDLYRRLLTAGTLSEEAVVAQIIFPLLTTLQYLKMRDIIHRDIKPENLLLTETGTLKVADFGFAICCTKERPKARVGTLDFMPPEVIRARCWGRGTGGDELIVPGVQEGPGAAYDDKVDIWACGVLAFELLTGRPPFEVPGKSATCTLILTRELPLGHGWPSHLSPECISFIKQALCKVPAHRPSARELLQHPWIQKYSHVALGGGFIAARQQPPRAASWPGCHTDDADKAATSPTSVLSAWDSSSERSSLPLGGGRSSSFAARSSSSSSSASASALPSASLLEQSNQIMTSIFSMLSSHAQSLAGLFRTLVAAARFSEPPPPALDTSMYDDRPTGGAGPGASQSPPSVFGPLLFSLGLGRKA